jgi:uncharacterized DUF497 family protein
VQFEYDPENSTSNLRKHGIDFEAAKQLWDGRTSEIPIRTPSVCHWTDRAEILDSDLHATRKENAPHQREKKHKK